MTQGARAGVPRRTALVGLVAAVLPAAGCGIRLEGSTPVRTVPVPPRTPVPAETELLALTRSTAVLAQLATTVGGPVAADLVPLHRRQHSVLVSALVAAGVPGAAPDAVPSGTATATPPTSASPSASASSTPSGSPSAGIQPGRGRAALARAEGASAAGAAGFADVAAELRATIAALHAQRFAAAALLSGRPPAVGTDPVGGPRVQVLATATGAATYFLEVVSARSTGAQRRRADATLAALETLRADQEAGGTPADDALGHPLPFPVASPAAAVKLAREALSTLRAGYGEHLEPLVASDGGAGLAALTRWLGTVEVEAHRWGLHLAPFPGLE
jgi:hypothetical protein